MCHRVKTRREDRAAGANDDDDVFGNDRAAGANDDDDVFGNDLES